MPAISAWVHTTSRRRFRPSRPAPRRSPPRAPGFSRWAATTPSPCPCYAPRLPPRPSGRAALLTPIWTPGWTYCTEPRSGTARRFAGPPRKGCSIWITASTSASAAASTDPVSPRTTEEQASRSSARSVPGTHRRRHRAADAARLGPGPVYVSVDIDVLDPAHAPGTGTPEVAGLSTCEFFTVLRLLRGLSRSSAGTSSRSHPHMTTPASRRHTRHGSPSPSSPAMFQP